LLPELLAKFVIVWLLMFLTMKIIIIIIK